MILTADSTVAHRTSRRKTANGWHTTFIGQNRNTLKQGDAPPASDCLYPMAFLVEKEAAAVVHPHFHQADQYQVIVQGSGRLGVHDVASVAVHYTDAYSAYGPIVAADEGVAWFTLRNAWDPGARYMPEHRRQLREARAKYQHREAASGPMPPLSPDDLPRRRTAWAPGATTCPLAGLSQAPIPPAAAASSGWSQRGPHRWEAALRCLCSPAFSSPLMMPPPSCMPDQAAPTCCACSSPNARATDPRRAGCCPSGHRGCQGQGC